MRNWLWLLIVLVAGCQSTPEPAIRVGADQPELYLPMLQGKRVGLVVNQTSRAGQQHLLDYLLASGVQVEMVFAPEHGVRGDADAGAVIGDEKDPRTGVKVVSIYGRHKRPDDALLQQLDWIVFDIQDVGTRFYTYISSLHYMLQAAADNKRKFLVLDRPNPNGAYVDGPLREPGFESFVGLDPIPLLHGMTVGELARMMIGEGWVQGMAPEDLTVIPVADYRHTQPYSLPVAPSPNLPNDAAVRLYPSLCLFEPTSVSIGRGTPLPFQMLGHPTVALGPLQITPQSTQGASQPKWQGKALSAVDLSQSAIHGWDLDLLVATYRQVTAAGEAFFISSDYFDKLAGTDKLRLGLVQGRSATELRALWQPELDAFIAKRQAYLLYP